MANLNFPYSVNFITPLTLTPEFNFFLSLPPALLPLDCLLFAPSAGCWIASYCAASASCRATVSCLLNARLSPQPLIRAAASCCLCLPSSAGHSPRFCLLSSAGTSFCRLHLSSASRCQLVPLVLSRQVDCHVNAVGTPPYQLPLPLQPSLPPSPLPPSLWQPLLLPTPTTPAPPPPPPHCQQHCPQLRSCHHCRCCHHCSICHRNCHHPHPAVPSCEVRRLWRQLHPRLIQFARQPAILSSNAEGNRS
jgi:hypothetical protein